VRRALLAATLCAAASSIAPVARADDGAAPKAYFYQGLDYGSLSEFNPLTVLLNRGFDVFQLRPNENDPIHQEWGLNLRNVGRNMLSPFGPIRRDGTGKFLREEIFPLTWGVHGARWAPNYGLHLIGGGQTFAALSEWYVAHDVPLPGAFAAANLYVAAFMNEALENGGVVGDNTDCLADLYVFDLAGILLFSAEPVRRFFSSDMILSDWSLQPSITALSGDLHNVGSYYALKWPLPFYPRLRAFGYMGFSTMGGLSYQLERGYSVSIAVGAKVRRFFNETEGEVRNVIDTKPASAIFVDRNESLLFSVHVSGVDYDYLRINLYPNALFHMKPSIGAFTAMTREGHVMGGISVTQAFGLGVGVGQP
jgi:hypothetical protein